MKRGKHKVQVDYLCINRYNLAKRDNSEKLLCSNSVINKLVIIGQFGQIVECLFTN